MASGILSLDLGRKEIALGLDDYALPALLSATKKENRSIRKGSCILSEKHVDNELAIPYHFNLFDHKHRLIRCF